MAGESRSTIDPSAIVSDDARIGSGVTIGAFSVVNAGVTIGAGTTIGSHCVLGEPPADFYDGPQAEVRPCVIGANSIIRSHTVIYQGATLGPDFECGHRVTIREGSVIGTGARVGTLSDLQGDLTVGDYVRMHSNVFVPAHTTIEDFVWLFPGVTLTNDPHPPSDTCITGPTIRNFAAVAARALVMPGVTVGEHALVGAMSLVTRDVPDSTVVVGVPAEAIGPITDVKCRHEAGVEKGVYPWPDHFRRGYPDGVLPEPGSLWTARR